MNIPILHEDEYVLVVNKPAGILVHRDARSKEETLTDWILQHYPNIADVGEDARLASGEVVKRPGIVHRIDKDTSGAIVICKTKDSFRDMKGQFQNRTVKKIYKAFVYDNIKEEEGIIEVPIGRSPKDFRQWSAEKNARGELREAVTEWRKILSTKTCVFMEVRPKTGRTHQIRVHMKHMGHPVVSDPLYAPNREKLLGFERLALHAHVISFKSLSGEVLTVEAPYPDDFLEAITRIEAIAKKESL